MIASNILAISSVHGAIVHRDPTRHKDKDPSFSAKQILMHMVETSLQTILQAIS
jgi:hypothetical protein